MEIKIPKEVHQHRETIFFGLSTRQFLCSVLAVGMAVGVYFSLKGHYGPGNSQLALHPLCFPRQPRRAFSAITVDL